jgi:hypothetical protein
LGEAEEEEEVEKLVVIETIEVAFTNGKPSLTNENEVEIVEEIGEDTKTNETRSITTNMALMAAGL